MSRLTWDQAGNRYYETGVDRGVLFPIRHGRYQNGVAWNGLTAVNENPSGAEATALYADNIKYLNLLSNEDFKATVEAYTYPDEFSPCFGRREFAAGVFVSQQKRQYFGFAYRTLKGNDEEGTEAGYQIHLVFLCLAGTSSVSNGTITDSPEAITHSWEVNTVPVELEGYKPTAHMIIDTVRLRKSGLVNVLHKIEDVLYGTQTTESTFPTLSELTEIYEQEMFLLDSNGEPLLGSDSRKIRSRVFD